MCHVSPQNLIVWSCICEPLIPGINFFSEIFTFWRCSLLLLDFRVIWIVLLQSKFVLTKGLCTSQTALNAALQLLNLSNWDLNPGLTQPNWAVSTVSVANPKNPKFRYLLAKWRMSLLNEIWGECNVRRHMLKPKQVGRRDSSCKYRYKDKYKYRCKYKCRYKYRSKRNEGRHMLKPKWVEGTAVAN